MPAIRLYTQTVNPFTQKVELGLALKGLPYERVASDDVNDRKRWSPVTGLLPVIEIDGDRIADSNAILDALDERFPEPPLLAPDSQTSRAQRRLSEWSDSSFLWYWDRWREARFPRPGDEKPPENPGLLGKLRDGIVGAFGKPLGGLSRIELREAEVLNGLADRFGDLVGFLGNRPFFYAAQPSRADISVFAMLCVLRDGPMPGADRLVAERPELVAYMERMDERTAARLSGRSLELAERRTAESPSPA